MEDALVDGVILAKLTKVFSPQLVKRIFVSSKPHFRHTENINYFFQFLEQIGMPDLFTFELTDLYDRKNIPKVIYSLHALSFILSSGGLAPSIGNLVGKLEFSDDQLHKTQRGLDASGISLPNFGNMNSHFGNVREPTPEPEISEEERLAMELVEAVPDIEQLQAIARGHLFRFQFAADKYILMKCVDSINRLLACYRAGLVRKRIKKINQTLIDGPFAYQKSKSWIPAMQAVIRGRRLRREIDEVRADLKFLGKEQVLSLQSIIRGNGARRQMKERSSLNEKTIDMLIALQSICRGHLVRKQQSKSYTNLNSTLTLVALVDLQSICRGRLSRACVKKSKACLNEPQVQSQIKILQSIARGSAVRRRLGEQKSLYDENMILSMQSAIRGHNIRKSMRRREKELQSHEESFSSFQAIARGYLSRLAKRSQMSFLAASPDASLISFQAICRGFLARKVQSALLNSIQTFDVTSLQSAIRGRRVRKDVKIKVEYVLDHSSWVNSLQTASRAFLLREKMSKLRDAIASVPEELIVDFQSSCRACLVRRDCRFKLETLRWQEDRIIEIQSQMRAADVREAMRMFRRQLEFHEVAVVKLQSMFRGIMTRFARDELMDEFYDAEESITMAQAHIRGALVRTKFNERMAFFRKNLESVIKIQSFVRAKKQGDAYKSLITGLNPPVSTVKKFVHLLGDSDLDFDQELELEQLRKQVAEDVRNNDMLEQYITQLDVKIALLLKNKITIDELIKHRNKGRLALLDRSTSSGPDSNALATTLSNTAGASGPTTLARDSFDLKALNKASRRRLELYQGLFYVLQTQPQYFARLFAQKGTVSGKEAKDLESLVLTLFGGTKMISSGSEGGSRAPSLTAPREEFFLLKLLAASAVEQIEQSENLKSFMRGNFFWWKIMAAVNRKQKSFLQRTLRGPVSQVLSTPSLNLENDPLAIYRACVAAEESQTGRPSQRRPANDTPVDEAIQDPETRAIYISNLQHLRELASAFLDAIEDSLADAPFYVQFLCSEIYNAAKVKWGGEGEVSGVESETALLSLVGQVFIANYYNPAIVQADGFGVVDAALSPQDARNLSQIAKIVLQVGSLRQFSKDNVYLQPLNDFVKSRIVRLKDIFKTITENVRDIEEQYSMTMFDDLTSHSRPILQLRTTDILSIHVLFAHELRYIVKPEEMENDSLMGVMKQLGDLPSDVNDVLNARFSEVRLELNPSFCRVDNAGAEVTTLFVTVKRCMIYVLRVQTGGDLLDILLSPVLPEHEEKYKAILKEEAIERSKNNKSRVDHISTLNFSCLSYRELKALSLEKVIELESLGKITREDNYQGILNSVATDIRTKRNRKIARQKELVNLNQTLIDLAEKERYLENKLKTYNDYIEQMMETLQTKKGKKKPLVLPFTKQYFHIRGLQRSGRMPKFGSFKYSAANLVARGILLDIKGYSERQYGQVTFTFSSDAVGVFTIEAAYGDIVLPGATVSLTLDDLLGQQYNNNQHISLFDDSVTLNTQLTLHFIFKKFYGDGQ